MLLKHYCQMACLDLSLQKTLLTEKHCQIFAVKIIQKGHILLSRNVPKPFETLLWSHKDFP